MGEKTNEPAPAWECARRQVGDGLLSVIMPSHNLGPHMAGNIRHVHEIFGGNLPIEIIPVDDGSTDNTRTEIESVSSDLDCVRPVFVSQNAGKGAALKSGFEASSGNFVLLLDGDLDLPPRQTAHFFEVMDKQNADVVIGSKRHPESRLYYPWHRRVVSTVYYFMVKVLMGLPVKDTQTGIKLFRREVLDWVVPRMLVKRYAFDLELLAIAHDKGYKIAEAPITMNMDSKWHLWGWSIIKQVMNDTLAIFYRLKIMKYYARATDDRSTDN